MATFIQLTRARNPVPVWVNLDLVKEITRQPAVDNDYQGRAPERTELWFGGYGDDKEFISVAETPEQILATADPENACEGGGPSRCGYYDYLGAGTGSGDLSHPAWHAAAEEARRHMQSCMRIERTGLCQTCVRHEERLRA